MTNPIHVTRSQAARLERNLSGKKKEKVNKMKKEVKSKPVYYIREENGRYYVYRLQYAPVETLFEIAHTREEAEKAIRDHKAGKHSTQYGEK
jgi:hypothetical protein